MSRVLPLSAAALLAVFSPSCFSSEWFVAPSGNDAWSGTKPTATADGSDGPFATLQKARDTVRQARKSGDKTQPTITVRAGTYTVVEPLKLEAQDSGEPGMPVLWRAYMGEQPVLSGAIHLEGWIPWKDGIYKAPLGAAAKLKAGVRQVLLDGSRQTLARYPNFDPAQPVSGGWAFADGKSVPMYADIPGEDKRSLEVLPGDLRTWAKPADAEIVVFPRFNWWNSRVRVQSVDPSTRKVTLAGDCSYSIRQGDRYFFQNALEELDVPGEWYADRDAGFLYYWPPAGRAAADASVVVAQALLHLEPGTHDVVWRGFTMEGCDGTAVSLVETQRCSVESNWIRSVGDWGGSGVAVSRGSANRVAHNTIEQIGNTGIFLTGGDIPTLTEAGNVAEHNHIHDFGIYYKQGVGVSLGGVGNHAVHNDIHHGPRFGIMHSGNRHDISWNHIHDVCLETEDTGAIYSGGRDWITPRGTLISYNFIHDVPGFSMHNGKAVTPNFAWGIYLDDNSGGADVIGNIIARCGRGGMHAHGARDCVVRNNIFVDNRDWQVDFHGWTIQQNYWDRHMPTMVKGFESVADKPAWKGMRGMDIHPTQVPLPSGLTMRGNIFEKNIVVSEKAETPVLSILRVPFTHNTFDSNLYWAPGGAVRTNFAEAGPDEGPNLLPALAGAPDTMPTGWRWSAKPQGSGRAVIQSTPEGASLLLSAENAADAKVSPVIFGAEIPLEPGATYRLRAQLRASAPGRAALGVHSFISKVYFWMSPRADVDVSADWTDKEWVFDVPAPGKPAWNEQMKAFSPRIGWRANNGTLEVRNLQLHKASARSEWESWRAKGVDAHSLVADPMWEDAARFTLKAESPAWKLGFERIAVEAIGPQTKGN